LFSTLTILFFLQALTHNYCPKEGWVGRDFFDDYYISDLTPDDCKPGMLWKVLKSLEKFPKISRKNINHTFNGHLQNKELQI